MWNDTLSDNLNKAASSDAPSVSTALNRRQFLGQLSGLTVLTAGTGLVSLTTLTGCGGGNHDHTDETPPSDAEQRREQAYTLRVQTATQQYDLPLPVHLTNGDEARYPNYLANFTKTLPHDALGAADPVAYQALIQAMDSGAAADFEAIPLGGTARLANPQAAFAFQLEGADSHHLDLPAPPAFASEPQAGEMVEVYWQALTRDVPFSQYDTDPLIQAAVADLVRFPYFQNVTAATLFRGETPGDQVGPYLSQFLWRDVPYGASKLTQLCRTPVAGDDHLTDYADWLNVQNGLPAVGQSQYDPVLRYIRNGRDLAEWVRRDFPYQAFLDAALILLSFGAGALDDGNPYQSLSKQAAFVTFGAPDILSSVAQVAGCALKAAWFQKWSLHRRLRPEEFAGRVHNHLIGAASYPLHPTVLDATVLTRLFAAYGGYLLPMAYPEGCPAHPAYPAGHATIAGACATLLKAFFDESFVIPNPQVADEDGLALSDYFGSSLTVGGELNKLAANISLGRDTAGVHWRSDGIEGMRLGETVALRYLQDVRASYHESFAGFSLTRFDGTVVTV